MNDSRPQFFGMIAGLFLAAGLVFSAMLGTSAWVKIKNSHLITVKGSARKNIDSDLAVWRGGFVVEAETLLEAQHLVQSNRKVVETFLGDNGITNYSFAAINIEEVRATQKSPEGWTQQRTTGYRLSQTVHVESTDVTRLEHLDSTPLVEQGLLFTTEAPQFIYTSVGETKIEMLAEATKNARARAEGSRDLRGGSAGHGEFPRAPGADPRDGAVRSHQPDGAGEPRTGLAQPGQHPGSRRDQGVFRPGAQ